MERLFYNWNEFHEKLLGDSMKNFKQSSMAKQQGVMMRLWR